VLAHLYVRGAIYCRSDLRPPWAFSMDRKSIGGFHAIVRGKGWLEVEGEKRKIKVSRGDLIVLPHGNAHSLRDTPATSSTPLEEIIAQNPLEDGIRLRMGNRGPTTVLLCGGFQLEGRSSHPLVANLPRVIHIRGRNGSAASWMHSTLHHIEMETRVVRPGARTLIAKLSDILFIQIVREYFNSQVHAGGSNKWIKALKDPQIGMAITNMHRRPENDWTVASLASQVGMSRSTFAAKFTQLLGEPPLRYLARWRAHKAAWYLRTSDEKLSEIARRVGYESETALSRVFRKLMRTSPGAYRKTRFLPQ
jgi:AraC family transcriptional regulator, alkane utilization regulator